MAKRMICPCIDPVVISFACLLIIRCTVIQLRVVCKRRLYVCYARKHASPSLAIGVASSYVWLLPMLYLRTRSTHMQATSTYHKAVLLWKSPASFRQSLESFRILFAYHSGKIENDAITYKDTHDIFHTGRVSSFSGNPRTLFEQQNQKICFEFLNSKMLEK